MISFQQAPQFVARIKRKVLESNGNSERSTYHLVLDMKGASLPFKEGSSAAIFPQNDPEIVNKTLIALKRSGEEKILYHQQEMPLKDYLTHKVSITKLSGKLVHLILEKNPGPAKDLLSPDAIPQFEEYCSEHDLWDLLKIHPCDLSLEELTENLLPQQPRYYSIASAYDPKREEMDLLVILVTYETCNIQRKGVATHFLIHQAKENETPIPLFIQPARHFSLPEDTSKNIIMIAAGTGLAPYRAFIQKRKMQQASGKNWLFFGERKRAEDFYYQDELLGWEKEKFLRLDLAFSRDQEEKIYVQHKVLEHGQEIFEWLEKGAYFYICGKGKSMAKEVHEALLFIIKTYGKKTDEETIDYLRGLRKEARYMRDVY